MILPRLPIRLRREANMLFLETIPLLAGLLRLFPRDGGWFHLGTLAERATDCFPADLSPKARVHLTRRCFELGSTWIAGAPIPRWIGVDLDTDELTCPPPPDCLQIGEGLFGVRVPTDSTGQ